MKASEILEIVKKQASKLLVVDAVLETYENDVLLKGCLEVLESAICELCVIEEQLKLKMAKPSENKTILHDVKRIPGNGQEGVFCESA